MDHLRSEQRREGGGARGGVSARMEGMSAGSEGAGVEGTGGKGTRGCEDEGKVEGGSWREAVALGPPGSRGSTAAESPCA